MKFNKNILTINSSDLKLMDDGKNAYNEISRVASSKGINFEKWVKKFGKGCRVKFG
jgi:hypothetical protein